MTHRKAVQQLHCDAVVSSLTCDILYAISDPMYDYFGHVKLRKSNYLQRSPDE